MEYNKDIQCCEVIISKLTRRGAGTEQSPIRIVTEVFTKDGDLIAEKDSWDGDTFSKMDLVHFARFMGSNAVDINDVDKWLKSVK